MGPLLHCQHRKGLADQLWPCQQASLGRDFGSQRWGPRPLDLDIIFYGGTRTDVQELQIPHMRWAERDFVKAPVADLYSSAELTPAASACHSELADLLHMWQAAGGKQCRQGACRPAPCALIDKFGTRP